MKPNRFSKRITLVGGLFIMMIVGFSGCASVPTEKPDSERIKQDADQGFRDLREEEERRGDRSGY